MMKRTSMTSMYKTFSPEHISIIYDIGAKYSADGRLLNDYLKPNINDFGLN